MTFKLLILPSFLWLSGPFSYPNCSPLSPQIKAVYAQIGSGMITTGPLLPTGMDVPLHNKLDSNSGSLLVNTLWGPPWTQELLPLFSSLGSWFSGPLGHFRVFLGWQRRKIAGQPNHSNSSANASGDSSVSLSPEFSYLGCRSEWLWFLKTAYKRGELIIAGIKGWAGPKSRCLVSWM